MTYRQHALQYRLVIIFSDTPHFTGGRHVHSQHGVCFQQPGKRELGSLHADIIQIEHRFVQFLYVFTQHNTGRHLYKIVFQNLRYKRETPRSPQVALYHFDVIVLRQKLHVERSGNIQLLGYRPGNFLNPADSFDIQFLSREHNGRITGVYSRKFHVFTDSVCFYHTFLCHRINLHLFRLLYKLGDYHRMVFRHLCRQFQEMEQLLFVGYHIHRRPRKHIRRTYQQRETHFIYKFINIFYARQFPPTGLVDAQLVAHGGKLLTVFRPVNRQCRRTQDIDMLFIQTHCQIVRNLSSRGNNHAFRLFQVHNIHYPLKGQFIEIQTVASIIIRTYRLRIVVNHHRTVARFFNRIHRAHTTPVKFHTAPDAVSSRTQYNHRLPVTFVSNVCFISVIGSIQIIGLSRILSRQRIDLLDTGRNPQLLSVLPHFQHLLVGIHRLVLDSQPSDLEIGKAHLLGFLQHHGRYSPDGCVFAQLLFQVMDIFQPLQKPLVYPGHFVYFVHGIALVKSRRNGKNAVIGRVHQLLINILYLLVVAYKTMHALSHHAQTLLYHLLKSTPDGHNLSHTLHRGTD